MTTALPAKVSINLLHLDQFHIFEQLQLEEALLRADSGNWCIVNSGAPRAIVMGISGVKDKLINPIKMLEGPVPVIRRFSGGGTVFIDPHTIFTTWICNAAEMQVACCPQKIHSRIAGFYQEVFPHLGVEFRENDYIIGERKWGGNAQYLCKGRWLHHSSMLWDYDSKNMDYLLMPSKVPNYRGMRSHDDFLCRLRQYFPDLVNVKEAIIYQLRKQFEVKEAAWDDVTHILMRPHRKATSWL
jgi:lipoate---protein ligase